jgi:hypothetical protein
MTEHISFYAAKRLLGLSCDNWPGTLLAKQIAVLQYSDEKYLSPNQEVFADMLNGAARKGEIEFSKVWNITSPPELYGDEFTEFLNTLTVEEPAEYRGFKVVLLDRYPNGLPKAWSIPMFRQVEIEDVGFPDLDDDDAIERAFNEAEELLENLKRINPKDTKSKATTKITYKSNWSSYVDFETSPRFSRSELADWLKLKKFKSSDLLTDWLDYDKAAKSIKRLIEKDRDTTELLMLVYEYFDFCGLRIGDEKGKHSAKSAWGDLLAKKFTSDLIQDILGERKAVILRLNGGDEVDLPTFSRTYNRRFQ